MAETFTPAVCGGRTRRTIAIILFSVGAIVAAALLGALLGTAGARLPGRWMFLAAGLVAVVAALRETSVIFAALIGAWFLKEGHLRERIAGATVVFAGLIALKL